MGGVVGMPASGRDWPKVAIVILNWNGWQDTLECLESIEKITYPNYEVILVDNGSVDDSVTRITEWLAERSAQWGAAVEVPEPVAAGLPSGARVVLQTARLTLIRSEENLGFAGGCNLAVDYALARDPSLEFVFFLNNDARVDPACLGTCVATARATGAAIAGAVIKSECGEVVFTGSRFPLELFKAAETRSYPGSAEWWHVDCVLGAGMLVRRDVVERRRREAGYFFDPGLFCYCEELDLCIWAKRVGYPVIMVRDAVVYHQGAASTGGRYNPVAYYYLTRNRVHVATVSLRAGLKVLFLALYPVARLVRAAQLALQGRTDSAGAIVSGLVDGYGGVKGRWTRHQPFPKV